MLQNQSCCKMVSSVALFSVVSTYLFYFFVCFSLVRVKPCWGKEIIIFGSFDQGI